MIKKICVLTSYYPQADDPVYSFVGTLVEAMADRGVECHVISPVSRIEKKHRAVTRIEKTANGSEINVYCPDYTVFPSRNILGYRTYRLTVASMRSAIMKTYRDYVGSCDAIYSHFVSMGINAAWLGKKTGVPAFMAVGESSVTMHSLSYECFRADLHSGLKGVITVSSQLREDLGKYSVISPDTPVLVAPNGIDTSVFRPLDRQSARASLGADDEDFIVSFVGAFISRKGFDKLQNVIGRHPEWKCVLIGSGDIPLELNNEQVLYSGRTSHADIPRYLCASDVFALPTCAEGCCNAIIEAMGCGLPVVSSDRSFNDDILSPECSIRIDTSSEEELDEALTRLYNDKRLRERLANGALAVGQSLSIENRAEKILSFMEKCL